MLPCFLHAQTFTNDRSSPSITVQDGRLRGRLNFYLPHTHGITLNGGLDTIGAIIIEDSSANLWVRDTVLGGGKVWRLITTNLAAYNGLTDSSGTIKLGGATNQDTKIDLSVGNNVIWLKTTPRTFTDSSKFSSLVIGDSTYIPVSPFVNGFTASQRNCPLAIVRDKESTNENGDMLALTTGTASSANGVLNGFLFRNYTDFAGDVQPQIVTFSNSNSNVSHGMDHKIFMVKGGNGNPQNTAFVVELFDYDSLYQFGNANAYLHRVCQMVITNGNTHQFVLDSLGSLKVGDNGDLTLRSPAKLYLSANGDRNGIWQVDVTSKNTLNGPLLLNSPVNGALADSILVWNHTDSTVKKVSQISMTETSAGTLSLGTFTDYVFNGTTTTWTLPALSSNLNRVYHIKNAGSGNITLQRAGSDNIYDTSSVTSITIAPGGSRRILGGTSFWYAE
jgi:hypothetical protein